MNRKGYIYVWGGEGIYKIGWAKNPEKRVRAFPVMPYDCDFAHVMESDDALALEWFRLDANDLAELPAVADGRVVALPLPPPPLPALAPIGPVCPVRIANIGDGHCARINIDAIVADMEAETGTKYDYPAIERLAGLKRGTFAKWAEPDYRGLLKLGVFVPFMSFYYDVMGRDLKEDRYHFRAPIRGANP
jgi:hypothetical protein